MPSRISNFVKKSRGRSPVPPGEATPDASGPGAQASSDSPSRWPAFGPPGYLGQLRDEFQRALADERRDLSRADCRFYHTVEMPNGEIIPGPWDLRNREAEYLGNIEFAGQRVLEFGPASGQLSYFMERAGADVTSFDVGYDVSIDLHPAPGNVDTRQLRLDHARMVNEVQNSWWYLHQAYASAARMVYGNIYALPGDLGEFDVSVFAAILLHLRSPVAALEEAARRTRKTIVVTEPWAFGRESMFDNIMKIFPWGDDGRWTVWWTMSAGAIVRMLETMGFTNTRVIEHTQLHQFGHVSDGPYEDMNMFTVVGERA